MGPQLFVLSVVPLFPPVPGTTEFQRSFALEHHSRTECTINPYTNDVFGHTDKLVTHAFGGGCRGSVTNATATDPATSPATSPAARPTPVSYASSLLWRMVTPIFKTRRNADPLQEPIGRFADAIEFQNGLARGFFVGRLPVYGQVGLSYHHIGPKGGEGIQNEAHRMFGLKSRYTWTDELELSALGANVETGILSPEATAAGWSFRTGVGWTESPLLTEGYAIGRMEWKPGIDGILRSLMLTALFGSPVTSALFRLTPGPRGSLNLTLAYGGHWMSGVMISTPYAQGDNARQISAMPLGFSFDL